MGGFLRDEQFYNIVRYYIICEIYKDTQANCYRRRCTINIVISCNSSSLYKTCWLNETISDYNSTRPAPIC